jgi:hypothetical protein
MGREGVEGEDNWVLAVGGGGGKDKWWVAMGRHVPTVGEGCRVIQQFEPRGGLEKKEEPREC